MLIAFERPPAAEREVLAIGVAGEGFDGNLTSDTTRTPGFVLATDIGPTILGLYGIDQPDEMSGDPIRSEGERDAGTVQDRAERMKVVSKRRGATVLRNMIAWFLLALVAAAVTRGRAGPTAFALYGLSVVYLPALLLVGAAVQPDDVLGERLIVGLGAPALAALTYFLARGWLALARDEVLGAVSSATADSVRRTVLTSLQGMFAGSAAPPPDDPLDRAQYEFELAVSPANLAYRTAPFRGGRAVFGLWRYGQEVVDSFASYFGLAVGRITAMDGEER